MTPFKTVRRLDKNNLIEIHDWVHDVDSSTIYGAVIGFIEKEFDKYEGLTIPRIESDGGRRGIAAIAQYGDYILMHPEVGFVVMRPETYEQLIGDKEDAKTI